MESLPNIYRWEHSPSIFLSSAGFAPSICECESELTISSHDHRTSRPPPSTVRSQTNISLESNPLVAISALLNSGYNSTTSQDVPLSLNTSAAFTTPSTATRTGPGSSNDVSSSSANSLAAHYGIPQSLPRPPPTTPRLVSQEKLSDFESLSRNYLSMLANKSSDNTSIMSQEKDEIEIAVMGPPPAPLVEDDHGVAAMQAVVDTLIASPEFTIAQSFNEYLSSPFSTPYDDFSTSPMDDSPFAPDLNTPIMDAIDEEFGWMTANGMDMNEPLFNDDASALYQMIAEPAKEPAPVTAAAELLTMSPATPALDSVHSLYSSPRLPSFHTSAPATKPTPAPAPTPARKVSSNTANGTRRNITPDSLVPLDAPTQTRRYLAPSSTSPRDLADSSKKRSRSVAFGDREETEEGDLPPMQPPGPNATETEKLEWKRRLSTIAARKSRRRKLEHKMMLESKVEELERDREKWRTRCKVLQEVLRSHSVDFRFEDDDEH